MSKKISPKGQFSFFPIAEDFVVTNQLEDAKMMLNTKAGTISILGSKDGCQYTTTIKRHEQGMTQTSSTFSTNMGKEALVAQVKELRKEGCKQKAIADMLGISQSSVSKYLKK